MGKNSQKDFGQVRREYKLDRLDEDGLPSEPMQLFQAWLKKARETANPDPTAMTLSTLKRDGFPSSRIVLLKKITQDQLIFFTNYGSRKATEIKKSSKAAAHFYWPELERQVKIAGMVKALAEKESDLYFQSRPRESQIAAWASPQSEEVPNRLYLEKLYQKFRQKFENMQEIPRPDFWGGFAISPNRMEFWQGGKFRLHDRIEYSLKNRQWERIRLAP